MIYALQALVLLAAFYLGRHDGPACDNFSNYGSSKAQQRLFHNTNWKAKAIIAALAGIPLLQDNLWLVAMALTCYVFIMWPTFNIALNLVRRNPVRSWDYISTGSNKTDVLLRHWFGYKAGRYLLIFSLVLVIALNILMFVLYAKSYAHSFRLA